MFDLPRSEENGSIGLMVDLTEFVYSCTQFYFLINHFHIKKCDVVVYL